SSSKGIPLKNPNASSSSSSSILYESARVFKTQSVYAFDISNPGTHVTRLHFSPFASANFDLRNGVFSVSANGVSVLDSFSTDSTLVKEFFLMIPGDKLEILFMPTSNFAFVNAIEVFSLPDNGFFFDSPGLSLVTPDGIRGFNRNLSTQILETIHRINVGGPKVTPANDTLWRTWIPDEDYLVIKSAAKTATTTNPPNYQPGGATRETAPDSVYTTAQQMNILNHSVSSLFNISWDFPVGSKYQLLLIRLHFCDIVSIALNTLFFDVYVNEVAAYRDVDLSVLTFHQLASPYYIDLVAKDWNDSGVVSISVGPSELSSTTRKNAILNGLEIMRIHDFAVASGSDHLKVSKRKGLWILVGSVLGGLIILTILAILVPKNLRKMKPALRRKPSLVVSEATTVTVSMNPYGYDSLRIPFADIQSATDNFNDSLVIGSGGFGLVYKATLKDNIKVAVKRGVPGSRQGLPEFRTEIAVLSRIRHRHLVSLVGYCEEQSEMILVYEYVEKGTLRQHLYGSNLPPLTWKQRLEICIGAARGLHYLHTGSAQGIIHRDIKSTNILIDQNYVAKVADFGLSKSGPNLDETHVSTGVKGSFGYLDPEYFRRQQLTEKSDVYSFGVVLFEVLCARLAVDTSVEQVNLAEWAMESQRKGMIEQIVDRNIAGEIKSESLKKFGDTAEKCLANYGVDRPAMGEVLWNLELALRLQVNESGTGR
ncbi:kinase family protein, partial [Genlisea aurea]